jgi:hypothetical protein
MKELVRSALQWLAETRLARSVLDTLFRGKARRHVADLDQQMVGRCQDRTLLGLVHKAHTTRFGRDHDFRRIRTADDFQRLVPLRTPAQLWREYWQPTFPNLGGATWPGPIPYLAVAAQQTGPLPYVPVSPALWAAQQTAALTALAFVLHARPRTRLCTGRLCLLGTGANLTPLGEVGAGNTLEAMAVRDLPPLLQPYAVPVPQESAASNGAADDHLLANMAERAAWLPVTCISGTTDRLTSFLAHARRVTGHERIADIWPRLSAILYARGAIDVDRRDLVSAVRSPEVCLLEMYFRPEGAVAVEDPRHGQLRLLPNHGVYFEFVPVDQLGKPQPRRYSAAEVQRDLPYALALSSPAGIWACLVGSVVRFERLDPPLLRLVEVGAIRELATLAADNGLSVGAAQGASAPLGAAYPTPPAARRPLPVQPPHPRNGGSAAKPAGKPFHTPWSARVDRG